MTWRPLSLQVLRGATLDDGAPVARARQAQGEARREARELVRNLEPMADQQQRDFGVVRRQCDVLEQPDVDRLVQERMKVEQRVDARFRDGADVAQRFFGLGVVALRFEIEIESLQAVRDRPAKQRAVGARGARQGDLAQQLEDARLVRGLDDDQRRSRFENELQVAAVVHRCRPAVTQALDAQCSGQSRARARARRRRRSRQIRPLRAALARRRLADVCGRGGGCRATGSLRGDVKNWRSWSVRPRHACACGRVINGIGMMIAGMTERPLTSAWIVPSDSTSLMSHTVKS